MYNGNNIFGYSSQKREVKKRIWIILLIFVMIFFLLIWKIANYMYFKSTPLKTMFNAQYTIDETYGLRYKLIDCNGKDLLNYVTSYYAIIDQVDYLRFNEYTSKYDMQALIITLRNYNKSYNLEKLTGNGPGEKLRYKIDEATYNKLKDIKKVKGFYAFKSSDVIKNGYWKIENVLTNTTYNKVSVDYQSKKEVSSIASKNAESLEMKIYNKTKNNEYTKIRFSKGVNGEIAAGKIINPKNNINVRLTINKEIQDKVETILHAEKYEQVGVVLMESSNGEIRAMAQKDDNAYNANLGYPSTNGALPGSIFKVIVEEAGLDMNLINKNETIKIIPGLFPKDSHNYEGKTRFTVGEALRDSLNNIFAQIGYKIGYQNMKNYAKKQGMIEEKVLGLQQEEIGDFNEKVSSLSKKDVIYQVAIGQKMRITPLEALSIPNTIINNGIYVKPNIIDAYVNNNNEVIENITSKTSKVLKTETTKEVKADMLNVVNEGTGTQAYIEGMNVGGKTGTTEYLENKEDHSDGWFVGFFTLNDVNYSMVVLVKNIDIGQEEGIGSQGGGDTAAPIFKKIVKELKSMD